MEFRNQDEKDAYWKMVGENNARLFGEIDRERRNRKLLIWAAVIAVPLAVAFLADAIA